MLDIPRLERIRLTRYPLSQRIMGQFLRVNYEWLPGVSIRIEGENRLPQEPSIFAMNHTDRYNYWPFQYALWRRWNRFTATWVKGKYYETAVMGKFMEKMNQLPTISRGYIITRDFLEVTKRTPTAEEYSILRGWVDESFELNRAAERDEEILSRVPERILTEGRNSLGREFDPSKESYPEYVNGTFHTMMALFVALNDQTHEVGLEILVFPQGTRSKRLLPSRTGISELALRLKCPIVPVGCSGSDLVYPGSSPWGKKGECIYRIGEPIAYRSIPEYEVGEDFQPFTRDSQVRFGDKFEALAAVVTERINQLLDEPYRLSSEATKNDRSESERFV